jgi:hypothetical protein
MDSTAFPTKPIDVVALTTVEFSFDVDGNDGPSLAVVCVDDVTWGNIEMRLRRRHQAPLAQHRTSRLPALGTTTPAAAAATGLGFRTGLVDGQLPPAEAVIGQLTNGGLCLFVGGHFDEGKTTRATRRVIPHHVDALDGSGRCKQRLEVLVTGFVREVADVKLSSHVSTRFRSTQEH